MDVSLITVSYRGDFELACDLCASVDAHVEPAIEHVLIVPRRDLSLFKSLAAGRRRLLAQEDLLPPLWVPLPLPKRLPFGDRRLRSMWLTPHGLVRGWIMQQIIKLSADRIADREILIFADSDVTFIRSLTKEAAVRDGRVRLYHRPGETKGSAAHRSWHAEAARLLGLPATDYFGADYIGQLVIWRRSVLLKLQDQISQRFRRDWRVTLSRSPALSEYVLYGVFAEHALKAESGHYADTADWTHASWRYGDSIENLQAFTAGIRPEHIAVLIQSTMPLSRDERRALITTMTDQLKRVA